MKKNCFPLLFAFFFCLLATPIWASSLLYDNGPINGTINAWGIYSSEVTNSFTLSDTYNLELVQIGSWVRSGDTLNQVSWKIGTTSFDDSLGSGISLVNNTFYSYNVWNLYDIYESIFNLSNLTLGSGTYYLTIYDGVTNQNKNVFWDENDGPSLAFQNTSGTIGSESFQIYGTTPVPEPATLWLFGSGIAGIIGIRRKFKK